MPIKVYRTGGTSGVIEGGAVGGTNPGGNFWQNGCGYDLVGTINNLQDTVAVVAEGPATVYSAIEAQAVDACGRNVFSGHDITNGSPAAQVTVSYADCAVGFPFANKTEDGWCGNPITGSSTSVGFANVEIKHAAREKRRAWDKCICDYFAGPVESQRGNYDCGKCVQSWECDHSEGPRFAGFYSVHGPSESEVRSKCHPLGYECDKEIGPVPFYADYDANAHRVMRREEACLPRYGCCEREGCVSIGYGTMGYLKEECDLVCVERFQMNDGECVPTGRGTFGMTEEECGPATGR